MRHLRLVFGCIGLLAAILPAQAQRELLPPGDLVIVEQKWPTAVRGPMSIRYVVLEEGKGDPVQTGDRVSIYYRGTFLNGRMFDQTPDADHPFVFRAGRGQVIDGWDVIVRQMREGSKYLVVIPPELAYGTRGDPPRIPHSATLVFEMMVSKIERTELPPPPPPPPPPKKKKWWELSKENKS